MRLLAVVSWCVAAFVVEAQLAPSGDAKESSMWRVDQCGEDRGRVEMREAHPVHAGILDADEGARQQVPDQAVVLDGRHHRSGSRVRKQMRIRRSALSNERSTAVGVETRLRARRRKMKHNSQRLMSSDFESALLRLLSVFSVCVLDSNLVVSQRVSVRT